MVSFMLAAPRKLAFRAALLLSLLPANSAKAFQQHPLHRRSPGQQIASMSVSSPVPFTFEQMPANPPKVGYSNDLLTVVAENSTLGDVLRAVAIQIGATLEMSTDATERVVVHLGPAPSRDVMAKLMNGSRFNYVILGSAARPDHIDRVILSAMSEPGPPGFDGTRISVEESKAAGPSSAALPVVSGADAAANASISDKVNRGDPPKLNVPTEPLKDSQGEPQPQQELSHGEGVRPSPNYF
jgi:hypothetical protein